MPQKQFSLTGGKLLIGNPYGKINWANISYDEIRSLSDKMFAAAGSSPESIANYYSALEDYLTSRR